jgi:hypothetical protein
MRESSTFTFSGLSLLRRLLRRIGFLFEGIGDGVKDDAFLLRAEGLIGGTRATTAAADEADFDLIAAGDIGGLGDGQAGAATVAAAVVPINLRREVAATVGGGRCVHGWNGWVVDAREIRPARF